MKWNQFQIEEAVKVAKVQNLCVKNISELRIGCIYLAPYRDPRDVNTFHYRARLEKIFKHRGRPTWVGCDVKVPAQLQYS